VGYVRRRASVRECEEAGAVDRATMSLRSAVSGADLVVFCTPISQMGGLFKEMRGFLKAGVIVTDVGSVKAPVVRELEWLAAGMDVAVVGSHPMAGSEKTGVKAARGDLYEGAVTVVTLAAVQRWKKNEEVKRMWEGVGSSVLTLDAELHDELVSRSSHLPHLVAACLADLVLEPGRPKAQAALCGNGFRDCTRVASGSPGMWTDIALANGKHIDKAIGDLIRELQVLRKLVKGSDGEGIRRKLESAKARRDKWQGTGAAASPE
jgi:prephenate dehydrogenase